jgi:hypothetical protein
MGHGHLLELAVDQLPIISDPLVNVVIAIAALSKKKS